MKNLNTKLISMGLGALLMTACSSSPKTESQQTTAPKQTEMDKQVAAEPTASTPEQIAQRAADSFANAPGLTAEQKQKLTVIYTKTYADAMTIRTEIGQSKSLLFRLLASSDYKSKDVTQLKKKITALDEKRLAVMFQALDEVQKVVGYGANKDEVYKHLRDFEFPDHTGGRAALE